jgi:hypothetical protein
VIRLDGKPAPPRTGERAAAFAMMTLGCAPASILFAAFFGAEDSPGLWLASMGLHAAAFALGFWPGVVFRGARIRAGLIGLVALAGAFALCGAWTLFSAWRGAVFAAMLFALWFAGLRASARPPGSEAAPSVWLMLAGAHAVAAIAARFSSDSMPRFASVSLNVIAPVYFLLTALKLNGVTLDAGAASRGTGAASVTLRRGNALLVLVAAAVTLAIANVGAIGAAVRRGFAYAMIGIMWLLSKFTFAQGTEQGGGDGGGGMDLSGLGEAAEPSALARILERVFIVIAAIIAVAAVGLALYYAGRKLARLARMLAERFARLAGELNQGYTDESERVFDWDDFVRLARERARGLVPRRERLPKWNELDNRARVRLAVRALMRRKPDLPESVTIRQALSRGQLKASPADADALASAYDAARYSGRTISDTEAENARVAFERNK